MSLGRKVNHNPSFSMLCRRIKRVWKRKIILTLPVPFRVKEENQGCDFANYKHYHENFKKQSSNNCCRSIAKDYARLANGGQQWLGDALSLTLALLENTFVCRQDSAWMGMILMTMAVGSSNQQEISPRWIVFLVPWAPPPPETSPEILLAVSPWMTSFCFCSRLSLRGRTYFGDLEHWLGFRSISSWVWTFDKLLNVSGPQFLDLHNGN